MTRGPRWELSTGRTLIIGEFQKGTQELAPMGADFCYLCLAGCWQLHSERHCFCRAKALRERGKKEAFSSPLWPETEVWLLSWASAEALRGLIKMLCDKALGSTMTIGPGGLTPCHVAKTAQKHVTPWINLKPKFERMNSLVSLLFIFKILGHTMGHRILISQPGFELEPPALEGRILDPQGSPLFCC